MAHAGHFDVQFQGPGQQPSVARSLRFVDGLRVCQEVRQVHPGAVSRAAEAFHQVQAGGGIDPLVVLTLDERLSHSEKTVCFPAIVHHAVSDPGTGPYEPILPETALCICPWFVFFVFLLTSRSRNGTIEKKPDRRPP